MSVQDKVNVLRGLVRTGQAGEIGEREIQEGILGFCQSVADRLADLGEVQEDLNLYLETIDEDLTRLEEHFYGPEEGEEEEEPAYLESACPHCHGELRPDDGDRRIKIVCPACGTTLRARVRRDEPES